MSKTFDQDIAAMIDRLAAAGVERSEAELALDDYVHDKKSAEATEIDNSGLEAQLSYVLDGFERIEMETWIDELVDRFREEEKA